MDRNVEVALLEVVRSQFPGVADDALVRALSARLAASEAVSNPPGGGAASIDADLVRDVTERRKELSALHAVTELFRRNGTVVEEKLHLMVQIVGEVFLYPDLARVRVT